MIQQQEFAYLPSSVLDSCEKAKEAGHFSRENIWSTFSAAVDASEKVYLIVDTLDESQQDNLIDEFKRYFSNKLSLMATARPSDRSSGVNS